MPGLSPLRPFRVPCFCVFINLFVLFRIVMSRGGVQSTGEQNSSHVGGVRPSALLLLSVTLFAFGVSAEYRRYQKTKKHVIVFLTGIEIPIQLYALSKFHHSTHGAGSKLHMNVV